ncbi:MAG: phage tail tube protein, partial [Fervidobacterium sp.]
MGYASEDTYGVPPTSTSYSWPGSVQNVTVRGELNPVAVYEIGNVRFPSYIVQGQRAISVDLTVFPQDTTWLSSLFNQSEATSFTLAFSFPDISQNITVFGSKLESIRLHARTGEPLEVACVFQAQNFSFSLPSGVTLPSDTNTTPYYFATISVKKDTVLYPKVLEFSAELRNRLERVYKFGQFWVRAIPTLTASIEGSMRVTFEDMSEFNQLTSFSGSTLTLDLGDGHSINIQNTIFSSIETPVRPDDLIALTVNF